MADSWSWNTVLETLVGTSAGALVGVGGIAWQTRTEKKERYEAQLTVRLFDLNNSMEEAIPISANPAKNFNPEVTAASVALTNISMIARNEDRVFIEKLGEVCNLGEFCSLKIATDLFAFLIGTIVGWRNGYKSVEYYLNEISERMKVQGIQSTPETGNDYRARDRFR